MADPSAFLIETLTGPTRTLELRGRALPYRGLSFEGTTRAEVTWFPGNAVGSLQVLGTEESPTTATGMWKDRFIKSVTDEGVAVQPTGIALYNGQQVADSVALVDAVELIRTSGQRIKLTWDSFTRTGIIKRFKANLQRHEDIEWEMEFLWDSRGQPVTPVTLPATAVAESFADKVTALAEKVKSALEPPAEFQVVEDYINELNGFMAAIDDAVLDVQNTATASVATILSPLDAIQRSLAAAQEIQTQAESMSSFVESVPAAAIVKLSETQNVVLGTDFFPSPVAAVPFATSIAADQWRRGVRTNARNLALEAAADGEVLRQQLQSDVLAVFTAREAMDLRTVATKFYGTSDEWRRIREFNSLSTSELYAGQIVLVPKLTTDMQGGS